MERRRLVVDGIHLSPQAKGVGLYTQNVLQHIAQADDNPFEVVVATLDSEPQVNFEGSETFQWTQLGWRNHLWHGYRSLPRLLRQHRPDVVWMPYETPMARLPVPYLVVCHDIPSALRQAQELGGASASAWQRWRHRLDDRLLGRSLRQATTVFSNSDWVGRGLVREFGVDAARLQLAPCAPAVDFEGLSHRVDRLAVRRRLGFEAGYVLVFHTGDPRENHRIVPTVFDRLLSSGVDIGLVVAGTRPPSKAQIEATYNTFPWRDRVRFMPFLGAEQRFELSELYSAATVYLDPSLQEGFGMQVVEAMACGTPVVCSDSSALPEVAGDAALLVEPTDADAIADTLKKLIGDSTRQADLATRGRVRARQFQWSHTAQVILDALIQAVEHPVPKTTLAAGSSR